MADAQALLANDTIGFPQLVSHGRGMVKRCMVWHATFLGDNHPIVHQHQEFINIWALNEAEYEVIVPQDRAMSTFIPTMFCRWFQLRLSDYVARQWRSPVDIAVHNFQDLFQITTREFVMRNKQSLDSGMHPSRLTITMLRNGSKRQRWLACTIL